MALSKLSEMCKVCPKVDTCDHKRMELCALAELPPQSSMNAGHLASEGAVMPLMRERIDSPLSPFAYYDELEKALHKELYGRVGLMYGA